MDKPPPRVALAVGCLLIALGWAAIYLGWQQAGEQRLEVGQLPYVISGGFGGLGLIVLGVAGILADVMIRASWHQRRAASRIESALGVVADRLLELKPPPEPASEEDTEEPERRPARRRTARPKARS